MDELAFIQDPNQWPNWPVLPLIRRTDREAGIIFEVGKDDPIVVYHVNLWDLSKLNKLGDASQSTYPNYEAMLEDWRVD